jgi:hypothetical protein
VLGLHLDDLNALKTQAVAMTSGTTYLTLTDALVKDLDGNKVMPRANNDNAKSVSIWTTDNNDPTISSYDLNMSTGVFKLWFSETVASQSVQVDRLWFQTHLHPTVAPAQRYKLTPGCSLPRALNYPYIIIDICDVDMNEIKRLFPLNIAKLNSSLSIDAAALADVSSNNLVPVPQASPLPVDVFFKDSVDPTLQAFDLNLTSEIITFFFSETIDASTFNVSDVLFEASNASDISEYRLTQGDILDLDLTSLRVRISTSDLDNMKKILTLATRAEDTYLAFTSNLIKDMAGNSIVPRSSADAKRVQYYWADKTSPTLVNFTLDLNGNGSLILTFDETVNVSSFNPDAVWLQNALPGAVAGPYTGEWQLSGGTWGKGNANDSTILNLMLAQSDIDRIKLDWELALVETSTYIRFASNLIRDNNNNFIIAIFNTSAKEAALVIPDVEPPVHLGL